MRNEQQCLDGSELWNSLRWFYDSSHSMYMQNGFDPLNGSIIKFVNEWTKIPIKVAIENLEIDEVNPKKCSWLVYGQFIWTDRSPIQIYDLQLQLYYDEQCTKPVGFVTFKFPRKPIKNDAWFKLKVTLTKNTEFLAWNMLQQPYLKLMEIAKPITDHPDWDAWFKQQPKTVQENFHRTHLFYVKICGLAREGAYVE